MFLVEVESSSKTLVWIYQSIQHHTTEDHRLNVWLSEPQNKQSLLITLPEDINPCVSIIIAANIREPI